MHIPTHTKGKMNTILTGIILCSSFIHGIHGYYYPYPKKILTSPCHVIDPVISNEFPSNKIGKNHWANGCPTGRYIKGVWAAMATEHFQKIKCCIGNSDNSLSWELRDLSFYSGGNSGVNEQWNIQCQGNAVMTGVRYFTKKNGLRSLSAVRCSSLRYQSTDINQCVVMDFMDPVKANNVTYKTRWQHECPDNYALVGLYDDNSFQNIKKGKCCKLIDVPFAPGWKSDFTHNYSNLTQSTEDDGNFKLGPRGVLQTPILSRPHRNQPVQQQYKLFRLMTPAFPAGSMCFNISYTKLLGPIKVMVNLVTADSMEIVNDDIFSNSGVTQKIEELYIKTSTTGQIFIDVQGKNGFVYLDKLEVKEAKACKNSNQCSPVRQNCPENEVCITSNGIFKCICDTTRGFIKEPSGKCVKPSTTFPTKKPTDGTGKDGGGEGWATAAKSTVRPTTPNIQKGEKLSPETTSPWTYVAAGASSIVILFILISGGYVIYQRTTAHKRRKRYFDRHFSMSPLNSIAGDSHTQLTQKCSISSVTFEADTEYPFYRPYMSNLGYVENAAFSANSTTHFLEPCSANSTTHFLESSTEVNRPTDPTTGDPLYMKIKREAKAREEMDENGNLRTTMGRRVAVPNEEEDEHLFRLNHDHRRPSTMTLLQPDYGDSDDDEDMTDDSGGERFLVPGDDEEELLCGLNELTPESVRISQKIIGQGAFGLVKLGEFFSTNGTVNVAVKILKRRAGHEITQSDRIKFYQEAAIMSQFDHENVINLFGVLVGNKPCMVIDHMERGNLWKYLNMIRRAREKENVEEISRQLHGLFLKMARDIVSGMTYLASLEFVHRDLAARNILLDGKMRCKISDFGLSRHFLKDDHYYTSKGGQIPVKWTAPEALQYKKYSVQSDVWSYGIVLWEIWSLGKRPYEQWDNNKVLKEVCENGYRLSSPDQTPILIYRIMMDCWKEDKNERPSFNQIEFCLNHSDDRILGTRKKVERTRSITFSIDSEEICTEDEEQIEQQQCRTE